MSANHLPPTSGKTEAVHIRRGLCLYKQPHRQGRGSPYWYARIYLPIGGRSVHTRSTGTTDLRAATKKAFEFETDLRILERFGSNSPAGSPSKSITKPIYRFDKVGDEWLKRLKAEAGLDERKLRAYKDAKNLYGAKNGLAAFFAKLELSVITTDRIRDYLIFAAQNSKGGQLAFTTKRNHLTHLKSIFKFAQEKGLVPAIPVMPHVRMVDQP